MGGYAPHIIYYEGIAKKAGSGGVNPYREVYGEGFTGECQCCGAGQVEDSAHVFQHCTGGHEGRDRMVRAVDYLWKEAGLGRAWDLFRWVQQEGGEHGGILRVGRVVGTRGPRPMGRSRGDTRVLQWGTWGGEGEGPSREDREDNPSIC